ncbi:MAG: type II toxin-antitoxin system antitoxin DNA ADP-ribosyl glycohydrolase DarG [Bacteroidia bacterium]
MIRYIQGNILESNAQALVNTVNTVGVMGKGIALQFKKAYPHNFKIYADACKNGEIAIGKLLVVKDSNLGSGEKLIINFPTKKDWRKPSEYSYIQEGLIDLIKVIEKHTITSIALPPIGAGNGGLEWERVKTMIESALVKLPVEILVYEPSAHIKEQLKKERIKLTNAKALLLYVLYDLVSQGEYVSEFSSEKVCYFLQRFGAEKYLKLKFDPNFYGPYSGKAKRLLNALNGSYIMGYSDMNKKPFEPLTLVADGYETVKLYVETNPELKTIAANTISFLNGFYSDYALEMLSTFDYLAEKENTFDKTRIMHQLAQWSNRKRTLFSNEKNINQSLFHLQNVQFVRQ